MHATETDLFGEVVITNNDVKLWLLHVAKIDFTSNSRIEYYINNQDVINKIKLSKIKNRFTETIDNNEIISTLDSFDFDKFFKRYSEPEKPPEPCPPYFHRCSNKTCPIYLKNAKHDNNRAIYASRKAKKAL